MKNESKIDRRDDVNPTEGKHKYGDVEFADPTNKKYPIDTPSTFGPSGTTSIIKTTPPTE